MSLIRLAGIAYNSLVNGPGMRRVFFSQGCRHNCKGCFNPDTHDFNGGMLLEIDDLVKDVINDPMIKGITYSGGDPFYQVEAFNELTDKLRSHNKNISIWAYTGFVWDELKARPDMWSLARKLDVMVDGEFREDLNQDGLKLRGSTNQKIIDIKKSIREGRIILWKE